MEIKSSMNKKANGDQAWSLLLNGLEVDCDLVQLLLQSLPQLLLHLLEKCLLNEIGDFPASEPVERTKAVHLHLAPFHIFQLKLQQLEVRLNLGTNGLCQPCPICEGGVGEGEFSFEAAPRQVVGGLNSIHLKRNRDDQVSSSGLDFRPPTSSKS